MNLGYVGYAEKIDENENTIKYDYGSVNWDDEKHINKGRIKDGYITINKKGLPEVIIEEMSDKNTGGSIEKNRTRKFDVNIFDLIKDETIHIDNTSNCWSTNIYGADIIAIKLCEGIMDHYRDKQNFPWNIGVFK